MNLEKIKELEKLREELQKYGTQYESLSNQKRHEYIISTQNDFISFFKEKGFSVAETIKELQASYGSSKITIDKYNEKEWYMGCYAVWIMKCSINKSKYRILLIRNDSGSRISFGSTKKLTEDEKIDRDIYNTNEMIEKKKKDIEEFGDFKLVYKLINESEKSTSNESKEFENMKQLLGNLFN